MIRENGRNRFYWLLMGLVLGTGVAAAEEPTAPPKLPAPDLTDQTPRVVEDVLSGDVVVVRIGDVPTRVRLAGIEAPDRDGDHGAMSQRFLANLLLGESVYVLPRHEPEQQDDPNEQSDSRRRRADSAESPYALTRVFLYRVPDGLCVNLECVRQGAGRLTSRRDFAHSEVYAYYETVARKHEKGVWGAAPPQAATGGDTRQERAAAANEKEESTRPQPGSDIKVYITPSGRAYHQHDCHYVRESGIEITLAEAAARGLTPCSRCQPPPLPQSPDRDDNRRKGD